MVWPLELIKSDIASIRAVAVCGALHSMTLRCVPSRASQIASRHNCHLLPPNARAKHIQINDHQTDATAVLLPSLAVGPSLMLTLPTMQQCALSLWLVLIMLHCNRMACAAESLGTDAVQSNSNGKPFACRSNLPFDFVNIDRFTDNMCAQCLWYMAGSEAPWHRFELVHQWHVIYNYSDSHNVLLCNPECHPFRYDDLKQAANLSNHSIGSEFKSTYYLDLLLDCCEQARQCCSDMIQMEKEGRLQSKDHCPAKWDGFMCWNSAAAGTIQHKTCPGMTYFTLGLKPTSCRNEMASKECWANGTWAKIWKSYAVHNSTRLVQEEYTNYFRCSTPGATHKLRFIRVSIGVYMLSLVLTIIGLVLLTRFGMKKQPTLSYIHVNFLTSLIFTSVFSLCVSFFIKEKHYLLNSMIDKNPAWCRVLMLLRKSARLTNYCWMLNEGIILWQMIVSPFRKWAKMQKFLLIGWGLPAVIMIAYTVVHLNPKFNNSCWTKSMGYWELIYNIPPITFILTNVLLLINMTYIMFKKLSSSSSDDKHIKSGLRASLFLVPVFGIQYVFYIVPFDPFESCSTYLFVIHYALIITEALQGAMVATIFCFFNKEIHHNVQKYFKKKRYFRYGESVHQTEQIELNHDRANQVSKK